jgi:hypothetical protein
MIDNARRSIGQMHVRSSGQLSTAQKWDLLKRTGVQRSTGCNPEHEIGIRQSHLLYLAISISPASL